MPVGIDLDRFELFVIPAKEFYVNYKRVSAGCDITFKDYMGVFGVPKYAYSVYRNENEISKTGQSRVYISICNKKSLEKMREDSYLGIKNALSEFNIDAEEVKKDNLVVLASDSEASGIVNETSLSIFFSPIKVEEKKTEDGNEKEGN